MKSALYTVIICLMTLFGCRRSLNSDISKENGINIDTLGVNVSINKVDSNSYEARMLDRKSGNSTVVKFKMSGLFSKFDVVDLNNDSIPDIILEFIDNRPGNALIISENKKSSWSWAEEVFLPNLTRFDSSSFVSCTYNGCYKEAILVRFISSSNIRELYKLELDECSNLAVETDLTNGTRLQFALDGTDSLLSERGRQLADFLMTYDFLDGK